MVDSLNSEFEFKGCCYLRDQISTPPLMTGLTRNPGIGGGREGGKEGRREKGKDGRREGDRSSLSRLPPSSSPSSFPSSFRL